MRKQWQTYKEHSGIKSVTSTRCFSYCFKYLCCLEQALNMMIKVRRLITISCTVLWPTVWEWIADTRSTVTATSLWPTTYHSFQLSRVCSRVLGPRTSRLGKVICWKLTRTKIGKRFLLRELMSLKYYKCNKPQLFCSYERVLWGDVVKLTCTLTIYC